MEKWKQQKEVWDKITEQRSNSQVHETEEANNLLQKYIKRSGKLVIYALSWEPINNLSEQVIMERMLMRKIIGTFRSENSAEY